MSGWVGACVICNRISGILEEKEKIGEWVDQ